MHYEQDQHGHTSCTSRTRHLTCAARPIEEDQGIDTSGVDTGRANAARARRQTAAMSTMRRPLGTGPTTTRSTPTDAPAPRLLPAERVEAGALLGDVEHQDVAVRKGRRILGSGFSTNPEGVS
jgi:hypothetical protein